MVHVCTWLQENYKRRNELSEHLQDGYNYALSSSKTMEYLDLCTSSNMRITKAVLSAISLWSHCLHALDVEGMPFYRQLKINNVLMMRFQKLPSIQSHVKH